MVEFNTIRSRLYKEALKEFPNARKEDIKVMKKYLKPQKGETILEVGAGSGFFSGILSKLVGKKGKLIVADPSPHQLDEIKKLKKENVQVTLGGAEDINFNEKSIDAIWSFGAMHHSFKKKQALKRFKKILKPTGRVVIGDVFEDSKLAKHFDKKVDKYCVTGHKVEFWNNNMAKQLAKEAGFLELEIKKLSIKWKFKSKKDIGTFLYKLHAMTKTTPKKCLEGAEEILGVKKVGNRYHLNWPMKVIILKNN